MKKVVESGELGDIYYTKCGWMRRSGIPGWGSWFTREKDAGAGPIYDIGVHALDLACWLSSNFEPAQVLASSYSKFGPEKKALGDWGVPNLDGYYDVEDLSSALIKMRNGATVSFEVSWAAHVPRSEFSIRLLGEKAGLDLESMSIHSAENGEIDKKLRYKEADAYFEEMSHFIDCVRNDAEPITTSDEMLSLQKTLDMILLSSRENRVVLANEISSLR
ncbi:MAG: Gfo/Idh/MocA family oxidoreductase [Candidatus Bathyarchaeota archaeon]|nr:Gfo/Idh/MocA family oxidoreductase [Candidatus Bathyarchaeota archaeon]